MTSLTSHTRGIVLLPCTGELLDLFHYYLLRPTQRRKLRKLFLKETLVLFLTSTSCKSEHVGLSDSKVMSSV